MMPMPPSLPRTENGRRRWLALHVLAATILDGIDDDTLLVGVTLTTTTQTGEQVQHAAGLGQAGVTRLLIPEHLRGDLAALADRMVDLADLPDAPDSPGWLP